MTRMHTALPFTSSLLSTGQDRSMPSRAAGLLASLVLGLILTANISTGQQPSRNSPKAYQGPPTSTTDLILLSFIIHFSPQQGSKASYNILLSSISSHNNRVGCARLCEGAIGPSSPSTFPWQTEDSDPDLLTPRSSSDTCSCDIMVRVTPRIHGVL